MSKFSLKDVAKNLVLNFASYALPTVVLQFVVQPIIARRLGVDLNGQYLTLMSLNYFLIGVTAAVLNTVRMLQEEEYQKKGIRGDFNFFFLIYALILAVIMPIGYILYTGTINILEIAFYLLIGLLYLYHDYIFAQYRLRMQFNKILINNGILVVGYFLGIICFIYVFPYWQIIYIIAYLMGGIYDFLNTDFIREPIHITPLFKTTLSKIGSLTVANSLNSSITYFDKLLLYPILGGASVSIYNTASLVGKILILVSAPLNSLLLSYLVKMDSFNLKTVKRHLWKIVLVLIIGYAFCVVIGYPLTSFLYPQWAEQSHIYIPITVAANLFILVGNLVNTILIRFYKTSFQMIVQAFNVTLYLVISLSFLRFWGLLGFSVGVATVAAIKMVVLIFIIFKMDNKNKKVLEA